jgi:hypothetical protein
MVMSQAGIAPRTCKACTADILNTMIWNQKSFLPSHEHRPAVPVLHGQQWLLELVLDMAKSRKSRPMHHVLLLGSAPVSGQKTIPTTDDLGVKISRELRPVVRETPDAEVATQG